MGSQENSSWADDFTVYIFAIDGKRVIVEREGWNTPIKLAKGKRTITAEFVRGSYRTKVDIKLNVVENSTYQLHYSSDVGFDGANTYCDFWIINMETGKPVTDIKRGSVSLYGDMGYTPIFIPIMV